LTSTGAKELRPAHPQKAAETKSSGSQVRFDIFIPHSTQEAGQEFVAGDCPL
jgi:hypothetical protein